MVISLNSGVTHPPRRIALRIDRDSRAAQIPGRMSIGALVIRDGNYMVNNPIIRPGGLFKI